VCTLRAARNGCEVFTGMTKSEAHRSQVRSPYDDAFFTLDTPGSLAAARVIIPLLIEFVDPRSVVDVGCGRGAWLKVFAENGINRLCGIDGFRGDLHSFSDGIRFVEADLETDFIIPGVYDLAVCVEVAEHLPAVRSHYLVERLTIAAPLIAFSAAIPSQGGVGHVNEQWPSYWCNLFGDLGFKSADPIRPLIRDDTSVPWWYRQNLMLFGTPDALAGNPKLASLSVCSDLEWVHVDILRRLMLSRRRSLTAKFRQFITRTLALR
jgi:SAM-dependent methyltransferase